MRARILILSNCEIYCGVATNLHCFEYLLQEWGESLGAEHFSEIFTNCYFGTLEVFLGPIALMAAEKIYWKDEVLVDCAAKNSKECHNFISKWNEDYGRLSPYLMYKCQTVLCEISG